MGHTFVCASFLYLISTIKRADSMFITRCMVKCFRMSCKLWRNTIMMSTVLITSNHRLPKQFSWLCQIIYLIAHPSLFRSRWTTGTWCTRYRTAREWDKGSQTIGGPGTGVIFPLGQCLFGLWLSIFQSWKFLSFKCSFCIGTFECSIFSRWDFGS